MSVPRLPVEDIARVVHEANRAYCAIIGDHTQQPWDLAEPWQRESCTAGVQFVLDGSASPEEQHEAWLEHKRAEGWVWGPVKNAELKEHPCMVPYDELPAEQRRKDHLFRAIVLALVGEV